jgi:hypothetical protein
LFFVLKTQTKLEFQFEGLQGEKERKKPKKERRERGKGITGVQF